MKVAMFGPFSETINSGVINHVHYLSDNLEKLGLEVERISWKDGGDKKTSLASLTQEINNSDADIIHLHSTAVLFLNFLKPKEGQCIVNTIHAFFHRKYEYSSRMKVLSAILKTPYIRALRKIPNNIAVSNFTKNEAEKHKINVARVIGNGVPLSEFKNAKYDGALKSDVLFVGRFTKQKGIFDFIEAFGDSKLKALVIGHGDPKSQNKVLVECKKRGIRCLQNIKRSQVMDAYKSTKVFAFPSAYEPFGITGMEALAFGKPVVAYSKAGGPRDYIETGKNGLLIEDTPTALKEGVEHILSDSKNYKLISENCTKTAERYDWPQIAKKNKEAYLQFLK